MSAQQTTYELIGGAEKLRELVDRFYDLMDLDQWLQCMRQALKETGVNGLLFERLMQSFFTTADWMRNHAG